jgi:hypothetical protein
MRTVVIMVIVSLFIVSCEKGGSEDPKNSAEVKIKGHFATTKSASLDPTSATQVVLFNTSGDYSTSPVTNGSFAVNVKKDDPVGLIFTNESKVFLGYLTLGQGVESLPLNFLNDTVSVVDLGQLTNNLQTVSAANNILQKMQLTPSQIQLYGYASINFSRVIKNPDVDKNGIIDILENKYYRISFQYDGNGGDFTTTPSRTTITPDSYHINFITKDQNTPAAVTFTSSDGTLSKVSEQKFTSNQDTFFNLRMSFGTPQFSSCNILYNNQTLVFDIPDQSGTLSNVVNVFPTFHYDASNKLTKVTWEYYSGSSNSIIDASKIILDVMVQICGTDYSVRLNGQNNYVPGIKQEVLANPIELSKIGVINMAYNDLFGNHIVVYYRHQ